jgi:hypothetical protein
MPHLCAGNLENILRQTLIHPSPMLLITTFDTALHAFIKQWEQTTPQN